MAFSTLLLKLATDKSEFQRAFNRLARALEVFPGAATAA